MITMVIFSPAIMVPAIAFPTSVPVFVLVVIVFTVKLSIVSVVNHISRTVTICPNFVVTFVILVWCISAVVYIVSVKLTVVCTFISC